jgi:hypothetical protein
MRNNPLKNWMQLATGAEQQALADAACNGSRPYLYQLANGHREASPKVGALIERHTAKVNRESDGRLPVVWRVDLVSACGECEFAKKCMAGKL